MAVPRPIVNVLSGAISGSGNKQLQDADARKQLNSNIFYTTSFSTTKWTIHIRSTSRKFTHLFDW